MKKLFLVIVLLICISTVSLLAWEPSDLTKYPSCMGAGDFIFNVGAGLPLPWGIFGWNDLFIPPVRVSLDLNIPMGDKKLPFFAGGILGYSGYSDFHIFSAGGRFGYHFNWDVDRLDTYAVVTAGLIVYGGDSAKWLGARRFGDAFYGVNIGARYFISKNFGFWAETGFTSLSIFDIGLTFKF